MAVVTCGCKYGLASNTLCHVTWYSMYIIAILRWNYLRLYRFVIGTSYLSYPSFSLDQRIFREDFDSKLLFKPDQRFPRPDRYPDIFSKSDQLLDWFFRMNEVRMYLYSVFQDRFNTYSKCPIPSIDYILSK